MNEFKCKCTKCGIFQSYEDLKSAYMDGWNIGKAAVCWDCQKSAKDAVSSENARYVEILGIE